MPDIEKVTRKNTKRPDQIGGGKPGPGRKPGIPNKANGLLKDAIIQAAEKPEARKASSDISPCRPGNIPPRSLPCSVACCRCRSRVATRANRLSSRSCSTAATRTATSRSWSSTSSTNPQTVATTAVRKSPAGSDAGGDDLLAVGYCNVGGCVGNSNHIARVVASTIVTGVRAGIEPSRQGERALAAMLR